MKVAVMAKFGFLALALLALPLSAQPSDDYSRSIESWHRQRVEAILKPSGWLSLAGLFWLKEGENTVGSESADLLFPKGPARLGSYHLHGREVRFQASPGVDVDCGGKPVTSLKLDPAQKEGSQTLTWGTLSWYLIDRGGRLGIRLKDSQSPTRAKFQGIETYPVDPTWRLSGQFQPYRPARQLMIPTVLGTVEASEVPGAITFSRQGQDYRLDAIQEPDEPNLFIIFRDATSGHGTYGAGRFLYVAPPDAQGRVVIDFNRSYNPPCSLTPYATCPLPPPQNWLDLPIEAGEKFAGHH